MLGEIVNFVPDFSFNMERHFLDIKNANIGFAFYGIYLYRIRKRTQNIVAKVFIHLCYKYTQLSTLQRLEEIVVCLVQSTRFAFD